MADDLDIWFSSVSPEEKPAIRKKAKTQDTLDLAPDDADTLEESTHLSRLESTSVEPSKRYRTLKVLGEGGMGTLLRVRDDAKTSSRRPHP